MMHDGGERLKKHCTWILYCRSFRISVIEDIIKNHVPMSEISLRPLM